jgi:subtilisin family serine protease
MHAIRAARLLLFLVVVAGPAAAQQFRYVEVRGEREFSGELIVRPRQVADWTKRGVGAAQAELRRARARAGLAAYSIRTYVPQTDEYFVRVPDGQDENGVSATLMATGLYQYAEPNWIVYPVGPVGPPAPFSGPNCPNDPGLATQWHHDANRMDSCDGWTIAVGDPSVSVGLCDTGVLTTHEDLQLNRLEGYNAVDQLWESQGGNIGPVAPHGTMTTGCACGNGNNGLGISGVGWNLSHRMLRVSNVSSGSAALGVLQLAARTAVENGDKVASVSYSGVDTASNLSTATYIKSIGGLLVWAAGNDGRNLTMNDRDADDIIVAGGTDRNDALASFSAFGPFVDVVAPAVDVYTCDTASDTAYLAVSGTSFATPLTAGLCALIWSADPTLTPNEVESILKSGCDDLGSPGVDNTFAYGRINVFKALSALPKLDFQFPNGLPPVTDPAAGAPIRVEVHSRQANPISGSGLLHFFDGGAWEAIGMNEISPNVYDGVLPPVAGLDCGGTVQYYFTSDADDGGTYSSPANAPTTVYTAISATTLTTLVDLDFQSSSGWSVSNDPSLTDGAWEVGVPAGDGSRGDPTTDFDGSGQCWLTGNRAGNSDVDGGPTRLLSPAFDLSNRHGVHVSYARWFTNDDQDADRLDVEVSNDDGSTWTLIESVAGGAGWTVADYELEHFVALTSTVRLRFSATDNPNNSVTEAALDRFKLVQYDCPLLFDVAPSDAALGSSIALTTWKGKPAAPAVLFLVTVNGVPLFRNIAAGLFDVDGDWIVPGQIPNNPIYQGLSIDLLAIGFDEEGKIEVTNSDRLTIH